MFDKDYVRDSNIIDIAKNRNSKYRKSYCNQT